jgi:protein-S-isoprenylcysteine O-methyltransferase Ste14
MKLIDDWDKVLRKAWSMWAMLLAGLLTGCEAVLNVVGADWMPVPKWARMLVILVVIGSAFVLRLVAQKSMGAGDGH